MPTSKVEAVAVIVTVFVLIVGPYLYYGYFFGALVTGLLSGGGSPPRHDEGNDEWGIALVPRLIWLFLFLYLAVVAFVSFARCVLTDGGEVPFEFSFEAMMMVPTEAAPLLGPAGPATKRAAIVAAAALSTTTCEACAIFKPPRTHHCSKCHRCVLKYDHHCPWIGRCVGYNNYKYYLQFIFSAWLLTWVMNLTLLVPAADAMGHLLGTNVGSVPGCAVHAPVPTTPHPSWSRHAWVTDAPTDAPSEALNASRVLPPRDPLSKRITPYSPVASICGLWMLPLFFLTLVGSGGLGYLVNRHWKLVRENMTTLEYVLFGRLTQSRYSLGTPEANVASVFGKRATWIDFFLPTTPELSEEDGVLAYLSEAPQLEPDTELRTP